MSESVCWFCEYQKAREMREPYAYLPLAFAAAMPFEKMMETLCKRHRAAMEYMQAKSAGRNILPRAPHERRSEG